MPRSSRIARVGESPSASLERAGVAKVAGMARRSRAFEVRELLRLVSAFEQDLATSDP
jgi:hypothetical protein